MVVLPGPSSLPRPKRCPSSRGAQLLAPRFLRGTAKPRRSRAASFMHLGACLSGTPRCCVALYACHGAVKALPLFWTGAMRDPGCRLRRITLPRIRMNRARRRAGAKPPALSRSAVLLLWLRLVNPGGAPRPPRTFWRWLKPPRLVVPLQHLHRGRQECLCAAPGLLDSFAHRPLLALSVGCVPALEQL